MSGVAAARPGAMDGRDWGVNLDDSDVADDGGESVGLLTSRKLSGKGCNVSSSGDGKGKRGVVLGEVSMELGSLHSLWLCE